MKPLRVVAVASSEETRSLLIKQLGQLNQVVQFDGVVLELSDAQQLWQHQKPDLMIIDLTGREVDACLFIEVINFNVDSKTIVFGLHRELEPHIILKAVSSGVKEFIQYPKDTDALVTALEKYCQFHQKLSENQSSDQPQLGQLISVYGCKGGNGASTVAINLGHQLVRSSQKTVALLDMDQTFSNIAAMLNAKVNYSVSDLAQENPKDVDDGLLSRIIVRHETTGMDLVVACKSILDENPLAPMELVARVVEYLRYHYDYVVVDLPTRVIDEYHEFFVEQSQEVLLVSSMDILSLYKTRQYLDLIKRHMEMTKFKLLINRHDLKAVVGMSNKNLEEQFKYPVFHRLPNNWTVNVEAMSLGQTLANVHPQSDIVKSFEELASKLTGTLLTLPKARSSEKTLGLIERLTRRKSVCP